MPTAWDPAVRASLVSRARTPTPQHPATWGKFSVAGMLAHLNESARMATGELQVASKAPSILRFPPMRYLIIHHLPMPKSAPTAPELLARSSDADFARAAEVRGDVHAARQCVTSWYRTRRSVSCRTRAGAC